jgi:hypothetical protein
MRPRCFPSMQKVANYRNHADECRAMARRAHVVEQRSMLLNMAKTWDHPCSQS